MNLAERINLWLTRARAAGRASVFSRLLVLAAGGLALLVSAVRPWDQADLVPAVAIPLLLATVAMPDSAAPLGFLVAMAAGWVFRAPPEPGWDVALMAMALVTVHLAASYAAQLPAYARADRSTIRRWLLPATTALLLGPLVALASTLVRRADLPGALVLTITALAAATAATWYAATPSDR
jgi:hypothetical protein